MPLAVIDIDGAEFQLPTETGDAMYAEIAKLSITSLTTGTPGSTGAFDKIMKSLQAHLRAEFDGGRITGAEYSKTYIALTQLAMSTALQFIMGQEAAFWQAQTAQTAAIAGRIDMETKRVGYASARYGYDEVLPLQRNLAAEQANAARAQTYDYRFGEGGDPGEAVFGLIGKQKLLLAEQVTAYGKDAKSKAGKIFADAWTVQKTVDEGLAAPTNFTNTEINEVLTALRVANDL